jgi:hypothetical protein
MTSLFLHSFHLDSCSFTLVNFKLHIILFITEVVILVPVLQPYSNVLSSSCLLVHETSSKSRGTVPCLPKNAWCYQHTLSTSDGTTRAPRCLISGITNFLILDDTLDFLDCLLVHGIILDLIVQLLNLLVALN